MKEIIRNCIKTEIKALNYLADTIDDTDIVFLDKLQNCTGNVILSGIGKSLLVANKIAGTLSSIGMRAVAVSSTDMLHGNIGMLRPDDVLVFISNSGETKEVVELARHLKSIGDQILLSITGDSSSTLAGLSHVSKEIKVSEAGPFSIVPTSSTTALMAYGDALATVLAHIKGLTPDKFKTFHPGGKIGSIL